MKNYVDKIVNKFLAWELPRSVASDACVNYADYHGPRYGTNLLTADEASKMVKHLFSELLDEHENLQKFTTQYENKRVELRAELEAVRGELNKERAILKETQHAINVDAIRIKDERDRYKLALEKIRGFADPEHYIAPQAVWADEALCSKGGVI